MDKLQPYQKAYKLMSENANINYWRYSGVIGRIDDQRIETITCLLLENQRLFNKQCDNPFEEAFQIIGNTISHLLAHKIVSVQPTISPIATAYYTKLVWDESDIPKGNWVINSDEKSCITRRLKTRQDDIRIEEFSKSLTNELNDELLTDLTNNCGTIVTLKDDILPGQKYCEALYGQICCVSGYLFRKTMRSGKKWIVVNPAIYEKHKYLFEGSFKYTFDIHCMESPKLENTILMGCKGEQFYDSPYIWSPYIMLAKLPVINDPNFVPRSGFMTRYAKKLITGGHNHYARINLK